MLDVFFVNVSCIYEDQMDINDEQVAARKNEYKLGLRIMSEL